MDSGIASLKKAKEQIRLSRQSVLASAFSGKLLMPSAQRQAHSALLAAEPKVEYSSGHPEFISGSEKLKQVQLDGKSNQFTSWLEMGEVG